ncbi:uncharacterized protein LOC131224280 [Magnolia sinica]|uniref:uncharacterized protein LOC131224280 n=1 Tax=Magnolia sinica TaxID=86752 RepID=UPI002658AB7E|nr:uncharacterized protein LOC131224280 [Magnolia sinica]
MLSRRLAKWMLLLSKYMITYELAKEVKGQAVTDFLTAHPVPDNEMISDDFSDEQVMMTELPEERNGEIMPEVRIQHSFLTPYYPLANGLAEAFNKMIVKIFKKIVVGSKRDWDEKLQEALWAYQTTHRIATKATPYSLFYGVDYEKSITCTQVGSDLCRLYSFRQRHVGSQRAPPREWV